MLPQKKLAAIAATSLALCLPASAHDSMIGDRYGAPSIVDYEFTAPTDGDVKPLLAKQNVQLQSLHRMPEGGWVARGWIKGEPVSVSVYVTAKPKPTKSRPTFYLAGWKGTIDDASIHDELNKCGVRGRIKIERREGKVWASYKWGRKMRKVRVMLKTGRHHLGSYCGVLRPNPNLGGGK